jgi:glycosyltransferase involved in cell wall biosynthesis
VDAQCFRPSLPAEKAALRLRYGVPAEATVASHVGHLEGERNLTQILALQSLVGYHSVIVGSTSTEHDATLKGALRKAGVTVIDTYVTSIEEIYWLSDVYLFLTEEETAAIELPLSVLEAMACNLPVVCTPFGGLPDFFVQGQGVFYWRGQGELRDVVDTALSKPCSTRAVVAERTWAAAAEFVIQLLQRGGAA